MSEKEDMSDKKDLIGADLFEANLFGANLREADLRKADISRADLDGAKMYGVSLRAVDLSEAIMPDGRKHEAWREDTEMLKDIPGLISRISILEIRNAIMLGSIKDAMAIIEADTVIEPPSYYQDFSITVAYVQGELDD